MRVHDILKREIFHFTKLGEKENKKLHTLHVKCNNSFFDELIEEIEEDLGEEIDKTPENFIIALDGINIRVYNNYMTLQITPYYVSS